MVDRIPGEFSPTPDRVPQADRVFGGKDFRKMMYIVRPLGHRFSAEEKQQYLNGLKEHAGLIDRALSTDSFFMLTIHLLSEGIADPQIDKEAKTLLTSICIKNLGKIEEKIRELPTLSGVVAVGHVHDAIETLTNLSKYTDGNEKKVWTDLIVRNSDRITEPFMRILGILLVDDFLKLINATGDEVFVRTLLSKLADSNKEEDWQFLARLLSKLALEKKSPNSYGYIGTETIAMLLKRFGLDFQEVTNDWTNSIGGESETQGRERAANAVMYHLEVLLGLEQQRPGAAKFLCDEFGIKKFGRYPVEMLVKQYDQRNDGDLPYGAIIYPRADHNNAFIENQHYFFNNPLQNLLDQLGGKYNIRVIEAESKLELGKMLIRLSRKYGRQHKISFAIIGGHGTKDSIQFGGADPIHSLTTDDLSGEGIGRTSGFFEPNATIILQSCSTGKARGIAQRLSEVLGAEVIAPKIPTSIEDINVHIGKNNKLDFEVKYRPEEQDENPAETYSSGNKSPRRI